MVFLQNNTFVALIVTCLLVGQSLVYGFCNQGQGKLPGSSFLNHEAISIRHSRSPVKVALYRPINSLPGARSTKGSITSLAAIPEIEKWRIIKGGSVQGFVKKHPTIPDGDIITTSPLKAPNAVGARMVVTTGSGSKYKLMDPLKEETRKGTYTVNKRASSSRKTPSIQVTGNIPLLDDWKVLDNNSVQGVVFNHPTIPDGQMMITSTLKNPRAAASKAVVNTYTGSKYKLGDPEFDSVASSSSSSSASSKPSGGFSFFGSSNKPAAAPTPAPAKAAVAEKPKGGGEKELRQKRAQAQRQYGLTGETIGENNEYLLSGQPIKSTSGKSVIFKAYKGDDDGIPIGDVEKDCLTVKISSNSETIEREAANYRTIAQSGITRGQFVQLLEYLPADKLNSNSRRSSQGALVMERGVEDLKTYLARKREEGGLSGKELREAAAAAIQCIQAAHNSGLVWTDMKTENFIVTASGEFKGIDLESAMPINGNPVDYSPEACPPEFAIAFLEGEGPSFQLQPNYDVWSFGMMCYEMATGAGYFDNKSPIQITRALSNMEEFEMDESVELDGRMKSLIQDCLQVDPKKRPSTAQILLHPYFLTTGFGPFSF